MKFLIVDTYYSDFLNSLYIQETGLADRSYAEQWRYLMDQCFGTADFYSANLRQLGHEATEVVANCQPMQLRWAKEHGISLRYQLHRSRYRGVPTVLARKNWMMPVLLAQVKELRPDVFYCQDPCAFGSDFLSQVRPFVRLIVGQIASPVSPNADLGEYDLMLTSFPHFVTRFQEHGLRSAYFRLGFEPRILGMIKPADCENVVFVGGLSQSHAERIRFLEILARKQKLAWWGYGAEVLSADSPLRSAYRGRAWALVMYEKLKNAKISLNHHINVAENFANNMRLYEVTGVGSFLLTDRKDNLEQQFEVGKEAVAYDSPEECAELIRYYLEHETERVAIAQAGQQRTLREHTYYHRMQELVDIVGKYF